MTAAFREGRVYRKIARSILRLQLQKLLRKKRGDRQAAHLREYLAQLPIFFKDCQGPDTRKLLRKKRLKPCFH